jgi:hypothetical protein
MADYSKRTASTLTGALSEYLKKFLNNTETKKKELITTDELTKLKYQFVRRQLVILDRELKEAFGGKNANIRSVNTMNAYATIRGTINRLRSMGDNLND